ncbi:MAG: hypothetical protein EBR14_00415 [Methylophilaceae bacterium]|nr:hypothetical protein [Methylophilaceae bacterium]
MKLATFALLLSLSGIAFAGTAPAKPSSEIPTAENDFVAKINGFDKAKIIEQLGEPSKIEDVQSSSGTAFASIWQYHYLNTNDKGEYYQTTELDFIDDKVVMVVFMNNDGSEIPPDAVKATPNKK